MPEQMHRMVLERKLGRPLSKGEMPDHENGDGLDNRRVNIRLSTHMQNMHNCRRHAANPSSKFLGVHWHRCGRKWQAVIGVNGKKIDLGRYNLEFDAAMAREAFIVAHPELMARSNFT